MPSNSGNSNDQKLGSQSDRGFGSREGRKSAQDKGSAHELDLDEVYEAGIKGGQSSHGSRPEQLPSGRRENRHQGTNRETGSTRGGSFEHNAEG